MEARAAPGAIRIRLEELEAEVARLSRLIACDDIVDPALRLCRQERIVFGALARAKGRIVLKSALIEMLYLDGEEPEDPEQMVETIVSRLRKKLSRAGFAVPRGERHLGYRLANRSSGSRRRNRKSSYGAWS